MQQQPPKKDFFVSYNKADRAWADWIAWQLEAAGYSVVIQAWDFRPGGNFVLDMQQATGAERTIAVLSPDYLGSHYTQPEWAAAFARDPTGAQSKLLPVRVRECEPEGLLKAVVYVDLVGLQKPAAKSALLDGVQRGRAKPETEPGFPNEPALPASDEPRFPGSLPSVWNVPHHRNKNFTGREELLGALHQALTSGQPAALTQAIHGLGGVGKTQLATEYAYRNQHFYDVVWWMRSEEPAALAADYAALAERLGLPEAQLPEQRRAVAAVRDWLGRHRDWLLVFDNARTRAEVKDYLPQSATGHVVITSRSRDWSGVAASLPVNIMPPDEAVAFLLKRTSQTDQATAAKLAHALGRLPLALEQAGAYIDAAGISFTEYLQLFNQHHDRLLASGTLSTDYPSTVATTWDISFNEARQQAPAAEDFMHLCAFLAPDNIPLDIIRDGAEHLPEPLAAAVQDQLDFNNIIAALRHYSLIERDGDTISIHRLVQLVLRDRLPEDAAKLWAEAALGLVSQAFPLESGDVRTWSSCSKLFPHSLIVIEHAKELRVVNQLLGRLLNQAGLYLKVRAEFVEAKNLYEQAIAVTEETYGANHPNLAVSLSNLCNLLSEQGDLVGARVSIERALKIKESTYGANDPSIAVTLNNLGFVLRKEGDLDGALACYERVLTIIAAEYSATHPFMAVCLNNIGMALYKKGDLIGARAEFERALGIDETVYGKEHPSVAIRLGNLALVLYKLGDLQSARSNYERALYIFRKFLGEEHPYTASVRANLAALGSEEV